MLKESHLLVLKSNYTRGRASAKPLRLTPRQLFTWEQVIYKLNIHYPKGTSFLISLRQMCGRCWVGDEADLDIFSTYRQWAVGSEALCMFSALF